MHFDDVSPNRNLHQFIHNDVETISSNYTGNEMKSSETDCDPVACENPISLIDFLDFLYVSCHFHNIIRNSNDQPMASTGGSSKSTTNVDFEKLANNRLVTELQGQKQRLSRYPTDLDSREGMRWRRRTASVGAPDEGKQGSRTSDSTRDLHPKLGEKLDFVINEGILDPVMPFISPVPAPKSFSRITGLRSKLREKTGCRSLNCASEVKSEGEQSDKVAPSSEKKREHRKNCGSARRNTALSARGGRTKSDEKKSEDVVIHVCDEVKKTTRDFFCPKSMLVSKMAYFADVVAGQNLEDMDISVHCDIQIFDWLMRWVKYSANVESATTSSTPRSLLTPEPQLEANNVIAILVSANFLRVGSGIFVALPALTYIFLQMEPLLVESLNFCHAHFSDVVRSSTNLSCLNDAILSRLAALFTNMELEYMRDRKDRLAPRLWTKLIQSLCEPEPQPLRGHYFSLAGLYRCSKCKKCLTRTMEKYVECLPSNVRISRWGQLVSYHARDTSWDISTFISYLHKELKSWRLVYWKLWGHGHFLYCTLCQTHFPVYQFNWCPYHPQAAIFLGPHSEGSSSGPVGRYPCCGKQAFRYETLPALTGCQFREHNIQAEPDRERAMLSIIQVASDGYALCENPPPKMKDGLLSRDVEARQSGILLMARNPRQGLLPALDSEECSGKLLRHSKKNGTYLSDSMSESSDGEETSSSARKFFGNRATGATYDESSSSDGCESESSRRTRKVYARNYSKRQAETSGRYWSAELSARSNQDRQREFEEKMIRKVIAIVDKKTGSEHSLPVQPVPLGGTYMRLEAEWKEQLKQRSNTSNGGSVSNSSSNTNLSNVKPKNK